MTTWRNIGVPHLLFANILFDIANTADGPRTIYHAMPILLGVLAILAIAYRFYSAFLAARVAVLDDTRVTPAHLLNDGQNYHPTNRWVLFGHHFAAISGAGPLIGPVLAIQFGYLPGLIWLVVGVCLAGAVQDMMTLAASVRLGGKSLAGIARAEVGPVAGAATTLAILYVIVIALAGLGIVVVKALGGEEVAMKAGTVLVYPSGASLDKVIRPGRATVYSVPPGATYQFGAAAGESMTFEESFQLAVPGDSTLKSDARGPGFVLPAKARRLVPGSSWGTFTIACTIPIALFVGWYMYRFRKGRVVEASLIGAALTVAAVVAGNWVPGSPLQGWFSLTKTQTVLALTGYGFVASVLPVWLLLPPRDSLPTFLKTGPFALLVGGPFRATPVLPCPPINHVFRAGGPTFPGHLFPFVFICIMCGSISGFHSLVSSGTTPKMVDKESQGRMIGYGGMLMEGLVGIVALLAAASLDPKLFWDINTPMSEAARWQPDLDRLYAELGNVSGPEHLPVDGPKHDLASVEQMVGNESLRGR